METGDGQDQEIAAIAAISTALNKVTDADARKRVLTYVLSRYVPNGLSLAPLPQHVRAPSNSQQSLAQSERITTGGQEIAGIARVGEDGTFQITIRDLKARSGLDAAARLATVAIFAHDKLTGHPISSRQTLTPLLKEWRLYDSNTRRKLANEKGFVRTGDNLSLDAHAKRDAERFIEEILNPDVKGQWKPK